MSKYIIEGGRKAEENSKNFQFKKFKFTNNSSNNFKREKQPYIMYQK